MTCRNALSRSSSVHPNGFIGARCPLWVGGGLLHLHVAQQKPLFHTSLQHPGAETAAHHPVADRTQVSKGGQVKGRSRPSTAERPGVAAAGANLRHLLSQGAVELVRLLTRGLASSSLDREVRGHAPVSARDRNRFHQG